MVAFDLVVVVLAVVAIDLVVTAFDQVERIILAGEVIGFVGSGIVQIVGATG